jgi:hypothetical protein
LLLKELLFLLNAAFSMEILDLFHMCNLHHFLSSYRNSRNIPHSPAVYRGLYWGCLQCFSNMTQLSNGVCCIYLVWIRSKFSTLSCGCFSALHSQLKSYFVTVFFLLDADLHLQNLSSYLHGAWSSSSSSTGTTARCGLWPVEQYPSIFS